MLQQMGWDSSKDETVREKGWRAVMRNEEGEASRPNKSSLAHRKRAMTFLQCVSGKWPRSLFRPVQTPSWKERSGPGWDQDGLDGTWTGPG